MSGMECEYCDAEAVLWVKERWEAPDGVGGVERTEPVCVDCAGDVEPEGLDGVYANYEFKIEADGRAFGMSRVDGDTE